MPCPEEPRLYEVLGCSCFWECNTPHGDGKGVTSTFYGTARAYEQSSWVAEGELGGSSKQIKNSPCGLESCFCIRCDTMRPMMMMIAVLAANSRTGEASAKAWAEQIAHTC